MAGTEIFGKEEIMAAADVIERRMIHRYGSHAERAGVYRAEEFEAAAKAVTGSKYALAVSSGTAALITALKGVGVKPGDEVITSPFTFIATVEAIVACDAVPVLGELDDTLSLDAASAERLITPRTKAIMPVHMFGVAADMDKIRRARQKIQHPDNRGRLRGRRRDVQRARARRNRRLRRVELRPEQDAHRRRGGHGLHRRLRHVVPHGLLPRPWPRPQQSPRPRRGGQVRLRRQLPHQRASGRARVVALRKLPEALASLRATKKKIVEAGIAAGLAPRPMHDPDGDTATHVIFMLPTAEAARKFQAAAGCAVIADNTWHYAKHWKALQEMGEREYFGNRTPSYMPETMAQAESYLSRAVMFGLNIKMSEEAVEKIIKAVEAGAKAAR